MKFKDIKIEVGKHNLTERMRQWKICEYELGHRWFNTDEIYEQCQRCGHMRLQKETKSFTILHTKSEGEDKNE